MPLAEHHAALHLERGREFHLTSLAGLLLGTRHWSPPPSPSLACPSCSQKVANLSVPELALWHAPSPPCMHRPSRGNWPSGPHALALVQQQTHLCMSCTCQMFQLLFLSLLALHCLSHPRCSPPHPILTLSCLTSHPPGEQPNPFFRRPISRDITNTAQCYSNEEGHLVGCICSLAHPGVCFLLDHRARWRSTTVKATHLACLRAAVTFSYSPVVEARKNLSSVSIAHGPQRDSPAVTDNSCDGHAYHLATSLQDCLTSAAAHK